MIWICAIKHRGERTIWYQIVNAKKQLGALRESLKNMGLMEVAPRSIYRGIGTCWIEDGEFAIYKTEQFYTGA